MTILPKGYRRIAVVGMGLASIVTVAAMGMVATASSANVFTTAITAIGAAVSIYLGADGYAKGKGSTSEAIK